VPSTFSGGCYVVTSPNPSNAGEQVTVNVFDTNYQGLALMGFGTSVDANAIFGTLYRNTTGTLTFPHPGSFAVQATAADGSGREMSCVGMQQVD
jgi:hypothetical protein